MRLCQALRGEEKEKVGQLLEDLSELGIIVKDQGDKQYIRSINYLKL
ncbi:CysS/YqeB C-terminal domain-containing protein [Bacillus ndiopicus]